MSMPKDYTWGFMLENTLFMEFDLANHSIIEDAYQQKKLKQASHHIVIHDSHLPCDAKIYFGVAQIHLRMPGTRYYVKRKSIPITLTDAAKKKTPIPLQFPQQYPPQPIHQSQQQQQQHRPQQFNQRRRHSQTPDLTRRSSNNHLYMTSSSQQQLPIPSQSISLTYPLSASSSSSTISTAISDPTSPSSVFSAALVPFSPPIIVPSSHNMTLTPSFSSSAIDYTSPSLTTPSTTNDPFANLWNYSWLDSLYATSSTSSMQAALLIPWSTTPPPASGNMIDHQVQ